MEIIIVKLVLFAVILALSAYFSGTETALTTLTLSRLKVLKEKHPRIGDCVVFWEKRPNEVLAALLLGNNLVNVASGVVAASLGLDVMSRYALSGTLVLILFPLINVVLVLLVGEIVPKVFSRLYPETTAAFGLPYLVRFARAAAPVNRLLLKASEKVIALFGQKTVGDDPFMKPEELKTLLISDETLPLPVPTRRIMRNIIDFGQRRISRVMSPRNAIDAVDLEQDTQAVIDQIIKTGYSRVPVYRGNLDNIVGIIYSKDLTLAWRGGGLFLISDLIRPAYFVPETARIDQVLREFKTGHHHMALVVDEFGSTAGLATIEDLVEEIVGEIWDEYDIQEKTIFPLPEGGYLVRASESLDRVNEELKFALPSGEFTTVGGWVLDLFGRIPRPGETTRWGNIAVEIIDADKKKVLRVKLTKTEPPPPQGSPEE